MTLFGVRVVTLDPRVTLLSWAIAGAAVAGALASTAVELWDRRR